MRSLLTTTVCAAALSLAVTTAQAEQNTEIDAITVYGTSNPLPVFEYPGQVTVVTRDDIETFAPSAMSDLLRDVPGLEFAGGPRRTGETPSIRGLGGENVLILLDGARQSFISAHDGRFFIDPDLISTAEVVRGPASALYGSGAVGGVLAFETVTADDLLRDGETAGVRVRLGYQDVNEETFGALTGFTKLGGLDVIASFGLRNSGDIDLGSDALLPSDDDITTGLVKLGYEITDALSVDGSWTTFENEAVEPNNGQGVELSGDPILGADVEKTIETDTYRGRVRFAPLHNDWIDASVTGYLTETSVEEAEPETGRVTVRDIETTGISLRNASRFMIANIDTTLTVGGDWYKDEQTGEDSETADGRRGGVPNAESIFMGVFAQLEAKIDEPLGLPGDVLLVPGVRFDKFESEADGEDEADDDQVSLRFAASYGPVAWFRVFGNYSEGFRAPSVNELYLTGVHFPVPHPVLFNPPFSFEFVNNNFIPNTELVPEKSETFEFGAGFDFSDVLISDDRFQLKGSYYDSSVEDLINIAVDFAFDTTCFTPPFFPCTAGTTESSNVDSAALSGYEIEAVYDSPWFRIRASYAGIDGTDEATGEDLGTLTPDRLNLDGRIKLTEWQAALGARLQIAGDYERRGLVDGSLVIVEEREGYAVVDLYATWRPWFLDGLRIDAGVDNVFDEDYDRVFEGVSEPGINPRIAVSYQIGFGGK